MNETELKDFIRSHLRNGVSPREIKEILREEGVDPERVKTLISEEGTRMRDRVKRKSEADQKAKKAGALGILILGILGNVFLFTFSQNYVVISGLFIGMVIYGLLALFV